MVGNRGAISQLQLDRPTPVSGISGQVVQIATSNSDGYALTSSGTVWAWGVASYGELGNGTHPAYSTRAVKVEFPAGVTDRLIGEPHALRRRVGHRLAGPRLGVGSQRPRRPVPVRSQELRPSELPLSDVTLATGARTHSLFESGGKVYACGSGQYGVLGTGTTANSSTPVPVVGLPSTARVTALTSSWEGSGALLDNGDYYNWGYNAAGQLGNGTTADSAVPVRVDTARCGPAGVPGRQRSQERPDRRHPGRRLGVGVGRQRPGPARRRHEGQLGRPGARRRSPTG